ncbi:exocyst complex component 3 [Polymixia lowei]
MLRFRRKSNARLTGEEAPILERMNGQEQVDNAPASGNPSTQNSLYIQQEHASQDNQTELRDLAAVLDVAHDDVPDQPNAPEGGSSAEPAPALQEDYSDVERRRRGSLLLIKASVHKHFPKLPAEGDMNLERHLLNVKETLNRQLLRSAPLLKQQCLLGSLIDSYHRYTFDHLHGLLFHVTSTKKAFILLEWVLHTYLSHELLGNPALQDQGPKVTVDLVLLAEWIPLAQEKLLANLQEDVCSSLNKIFQNEFSDVKSDDCEDEEAFIRLQVDVIQCIDAKLKRAQEISPTLMDQVRKVCFQELHQFVMKYIHDQKSILGTQAKMSEPGVMHFLKTLKTSQTLMQYIQTKNEGIKDAPHVQTISALKNMEAFAVKLLTQTLTRIAEIHLKKYFKTDDKEMPVLINTIRELFHKCPCSMDVDKRVLDEVYQYICHLYLKLLVRSSQRKLKKLWHDGVDSNVTEDAEQLHSMFSKLHPDVRQQNIMLLKVPEVLKCKSTDALKITVGQMLVGEDGLPNPSVDKKMLPVLLRWKGGLSQREILEVLDACLPESEPRPTGCCSGLFS